MDELTRRSAQQFGRRAAEYVDSAAHATGDSLALIREWLADDGTARVLDVATGAGHAALAAAAVARLVVAYDLTAEMLAEARRLAAKRGVEALRYAQGIAEHLPFADNAFDAVICRVAAHHFASPEAFLDESRRVTRPGGRVILIDTTVPDDERIAAWQNAVEKARDGSHHRNRSLSEWQQTFARSGLEPARAELQTSHHTFRDWVRRSATPADEVAWLEQQFRDADDGVRNAFSIQAIEPDDYAFQWPIACLEGLVPAA